LFLRLTCLLSDHVNLDLPLDGLDTVSLFVDSLILLIQNRKTLLLGGNIFDFDIIVSR
jgi:hypothetical protein